MEGKGVRAYAAKLLLLKDADRWGRGNEPEIWIQEEHWQTVFFLFSFVLFSPFKPIWTKTLNSSRVPKTKITVLSYNGVLVQRGILTEETGDNQCRPDQAP